MLNLDEVLLNFNRASFRASPKKKGGKLMASQLISKIKLGGLLETLRMLQEQGMGEADFVYLRKDHDLIREVFRVVRDKFILQDKYVGGHRKAAQVERFREWNRIFNLGISDDEFRLIPDFPEPPASSLNQLFCTCLVYEFGDPLITLMRGIKISNYVLQEKRRWLDVQFGRYDPQKDIHIIPEENEINSQIRLRPDAQKRKKGFRWIIVELGRSFQLQKLEKEIEKCSCFGLLRTIKANQLITEECDKRGVTGVGQELPFIAAMYPDWILSTMKGKCSYLYPVPLAIDIQLIPAWEKDFSKGAEVLAIINDDSRWSQLSINGFNFSLSSSVGCGICTIVNSV